VSLRENRFYKLSLHRHDGGGGESACSAGQDVGREEKIGRRNNRERGGRDKRTTNRKRVSGPGGGGLNARRTEETGCKGIRNKLEEEVWKRTIGTTVHLVSTGTEQSVQNLMP
jgi:hypothetical protein